MGILWKPEEDALLRKYYPEHGPRGCMRFIKNRSHLGIEKRASVLYVRIAPGNQRNGWTKAQNDILRKYWPEFGRDGCIPHLPGRTPQAICNQAKRLKLVNIDYAKRMRPKDFPESDMRSVTRKPWLPLDVVKWIDEVMA